MDDSVRDKLFAKRVKLLKDEGKKPSQIIKRSTWNRANWPTLKRIATKFAREDDDDEKEEGLDFLKGEKRAQKVVDFICSDAYKNTFGKPFSQPQRITHMAQIASILSALSSEDDEFKKSWKLFSAAAVSLRGKQREKESKNELSEKEKANLRLWEEYVSAFDKISCITYPKEKCIVGLFTVISPRRASILRMYLGSPKRPVRKKKKKDNGEGEEKEEEEKEEAGEKKNILDLKRGVILLNNYKTSKSYGEQIVSLPKKLVECFKRYIREYNIKPGQPVFQSSGGMMVSNPSLLVKQAFRRGGMKNVTVNYLRHARIMDMYESNTSVKEKEDLAKEMNHSVQTQSFYNRIEKTEKKGAEKDE